MQHSPDAHQYLYGIFGFLIEYINDNYLINDSLLELAYQLINHNFQEENENDNDVFYNTVSLFKTGFSEKTAKALAYGIRDAIKSEV